MNMFKIWKGANKMNKLRLKCEFEKKKKSFPLQP